jgi:YesN/AraC family two-component response regulator
MIGRAERFSSCSKGGKPSILLVEDDPLSREQLVELLRPQSEGLHVAENGEQGLSLYQEQRPDIVITDILMPVMDGLEMARKIRSINRTAQIIVITAYSDMDAFIDSKQIPVHMVWKPVDINELFHAVDQCKEKIVKITAEEDGRGSSGDSAGN